MTRIKIEDMPEVKPENLRHLKRYINFINSRPERKLHQKGFSTHHIYPTSIAVKKNKIDYKEDPNLIELSHREHFIAHLILYYCGYEEMTYAFRMMNNYKGNKITGSIYQRLQEDWAKLSSRNMKEYHNTHDRFGENAPNYGKRASDALKKKMSESHLGKKLDQSSIAKRTLKQKGLKRSQAFCDNLSKRRKNIEVDESTKKLISMSLTGRRQITNGTTTYSLKKEESIPEGFFYTRHKKIRSSQSYMYIFNRAIISIDLLKTLNFTKPSIIMITNEIKNRGISSLSKVPFGWRTGTKDEGKWIWINNNKKTIKHNREKELPEGFIIGNLSNFNTIWITDGISNRHIAKDENIPENWYIGSTKNFTDKGRKSLKEHNKNKVYITNGQITKQHNKLNPIPEGWVIGRTSGTKGKVSITDGINNKLIFPTDNIPKGWRRGVIKKTRNRYSKIDKLTKD